MNVIILTQGNITSSEEDNSESESTESEKETEYEEIRNTSRLKD